MSRGAQHYEARHERVCRHCGQVFIAKMPNALFCPLDQCQREKQKIYQREHAERVKARRNELTSPNEAAENAATTTAK